MFNVNWALFNVKSEEGKLTGHPQTNAASNMTSLRSTDGNTSYHSHESFSLVGIFIWIEIHAKLITEDSRILRGGISGPRSAHIVS